MKDAIISLRKEHNEIERRMILLEEILESILDENYEELKKFEKVLNEYIEILPEHRKKEAKVFEKLSSHDALRESIKEVLLEHSHLDGHIKVIQDAMESKNKNKIILALDNDCRLMFDKIREHINKEERIFHEAVFLHLKEKNPPA